jgi:hypothetical protein
MTLEHLKQGFSNNDGPRPISEPLSVRFEAIRVPAPSSHCVTRSDSNTRHRNVGQNRNTKTANKVKVKVNLSLDHAMKTYGGA